MPPLELKPAAHPSSAQIKFMEILFNDLGYTWHSRNAYLQARFHNPKLKHLDELDSHQASNVIQHLKTIRESMKR